jgi:transcriptional regulator with XRE-family HTH domain
VFIAQKLNVTPEAVRKWFDGGKPRDHKLRELAKLLNVDPAWLSMGVNAQTAKAEHDRLNVTITGASNVVIGLFSVAGLSTALPDEYDPRKDIVDFYVVINGRQIPIAVTVCDNGVAKIRRGYEYVNNLLYIHKGLTDFTLLKLDNTSINECKIADGSDWRVEVSEEDGVYYMCKKPCVQVTKIEDL